MCSSFKPFVVSLVVLAMMCLTACHSRSADPVNLNGEAQGTYYTVIYYDSLQRNFQHSIDSLLTDFDQTASLWVKNSELCRVNHNETDILTPRFADILQKSLAMNAYTDGCFDCTVGKLVDAWGFGAEGKSQLTDRQIDSLRQYTGSHQVTTVYDSVARQWRLVKQHAETAIDFNAIAQGVTSDMIGHYLEQRGVKNYLVDIGGEVVARGHKPDGSHWTVGIERPAKNKYSTPEVELAITLENQSVVTSGSYRKYYEKNGVKYSHTIDPATGRPVQHSLLSVSVIDSAAWRADALATAFMVMGLQRGLQYIKEHPQDPGVQAVFFIYDDGHDYKTYATEAFKKHISK
jgi:thiamine biosynthesis lipoprotein